MAILWLCLLTLPSWAAQDPTAPLSWMAPAPVQAKSTSRAVSLPVLQSIVCERECVAVMDDQVVARGDVLRGFRVHNVTPEAVTLAQGARQWQLELFNLDVKQ
ncbi:MSHA biogenesis protein MshK [Vibrio navarrensis]|uniref:MSHA biogenesis protein MshK n=1 Tax=Vibrio navarrensis TaxID=29495 RepID=UPI0029BFEA85|nr:MSHA biogenesis protein MshK [Vibrio navarrensis]